MSWCGILFAFPDVAYNILHLLMWRIYCSPDIQSIYCYGVHHVFPDVTCFLFFLLWSTTHFISWCGIYIVLQTYKAFSALTHILYFLILHTSCISWCGAQHTVSPGVAYFLYFLMWRTIYCIARCGVYIVIQTYVTFPDMVCILYFLVWRTSCIAWWRTINSISWYGVYIVLQTYIVFPDMAYILYYLMWRTLCISWCGIQYVLSSAVGNILFCRHRWYFLIKRTSYISWCGVHFCIS